MFFSQYQIYYFRQLQCELWDLLHCSPHKHKNRMQPFSSARFSCKESSLGTVKEDYHLGGFLFFTKLDSKNKTKTIMNCRIDLQPCTLLCRTHLALLHFFPGSLRSRFQSMSLHTVLTYSTLCQAFLSVCLWKQEPWILPDTRQLWAVVYIFICGY